MDKEPKKPTRIEGCFTHAEVAKITGKSKTTISPYWTNKRNVTGNGRTFKPSPHAGWWEETTDQ